MNQDELQAVVIKLEARYVGWVFIAGQEDDGRICIAAISPEREVCIANIAFDYSPAIRMCADELNELEVALAFAIGNRDYDGMMLVPIQGAIYDQEAWNPFGQELEPYIEKPLPTVKH